MLLLFSITSLNIYLLTSGCVWQWREAAVALSVFVAKQINSMKAELETRAQKTDRSIQDPPAELIIHKLLNGLN